MRHLDAVDVLPRATPPALSAAIAAAVPVWYDLLGPRLVSMILFGSVARGDAGPSSDIDVLIVAEGLPRSLADRARPLREGWKRVRVARALADVEWDLVVKTPPEAAYHSPLYLDMVEDAIALYDRDGFFRAVLDTMGARMSALGSRRVRLPDGGWYWDLKPSYRFGETVEI